MRSRTITNSTRQNCAGLITLLLVAATVVNAQRHLREEINEDGASAAPIVATNAPFFGEDLIMNAVAFAKDETVGMIIAALVIFIAAGGGTGGGGVLDPIYILIMKLDPKEAIPLSSITIVGGAIGNFVLNVRRTRKNSKEPLIDWDFVLAMQPMLLMGASFGTYINSIAPTWLLCILLVILLTITGIRTFQKAMSVRRTENWYCFRNEQRTALLGAPNRRQQQESPSPYKADIPWRKVGALLGLFSGVVLLSLLKGGSEFASPIGVAPSSFWYPIVSFLPVLFLWVFARYSMKNVVATFQKQQNPYYILSPDEIQWTPHSVRYFPIISLLAGMVAGMFGIGGGIVNGPLLLEIGIEPSAASAITATTVLFSSSMSSFSYILLGSLNFSFAQIMLPIGFLMTYIGHVCLHRVVQRFQCPSLIVFSMAIIVLVSAVAMSIESVRAVVAA